MVVAVEKVVGAGEGGILFEFLWRRSEVGFV